MDTDMHLGQRVAHLRRRGGISQLTLAGRIGRSESWIGEPAGIAAWWRREPEWLQPLERSLPAAHLMLREILDLQDEPCGNAAELVAERS